MKKLYVFILLLAGLSLSSCGSVQNFYQMYKTVGDKSISLKNDAMVFEDNDCAVSYYFNSFGGNAGFYFKNKTDKPIYINMEETFFIKNGMAYNYYQNRVYTNSNSRSGAFTSSSANTKSETGINWAKLLQTNTSQSTDAVSIGTTSETSVAYNEEKIVCIPANTSKYISEYSIHNSYIAACELEKKPSKRDVRTVTYTKNNSPVVFSNIITYSIDKTGPAKKIENEFYISEITNYPDYLAYRWEYEQECGKKVPFRRFRVFNNLSPDSFYNSY